ncbi:MAG: hemolysin family protein [Planctomycetota bacterium]
MIFHVLEPIPLLLIGAFAFLLSAILSLAEGALLNYSTEFLLELCQSPSKKSKYKKYVEKEPEIIFSVKMADILSDVVVVICIIFLLTGLIVNPWYFLLVSAGLSLIVVVILADALPYQFAERKPESILLILFPALSALNRLFVPITTPLALAIRSVLKITGLQSKIDDATRIRKEIIEAIKKGESEGVLKDNERTLIEGVLKFNDALVSDVMSPRPDVVSVDFRASVEEAVQLAIEKKHWRIPVHAKSKDAIEGVLYLRDILPFLCGQGEMSKNLREVMRKPLFVPATKKISALLKEFHQAKQQIAIVIDEYGGTAGVVTVQDIIEEIVGEIPGEISEESLFQKIDSHNIIASGRARTEDINSDFNINLLQGDGFETIGGLVSRALGRIPKSGDTYQYNGIKITVIDADERRVKQVRIILPQTEDEEE